MLDGDAILEISGENRLEEVKDLNLRRQRLTSIELQALGSLSQLQLLSLSHNLLTDTQVCVRLLVLRCLRIAMNRKCALVSGLLVCVHENRACKLANVTSETDDVCAFLLSACVLAGPWVPAPAVLAEPES